MAVDPPASASGSSCGFPPRKLLVFSNSVPVMSSLTVPVPRRFCATMLLRSRSLALPVFQPPPVPVPLPSESARLSTTVMLSSVMEFPALEKNPPPSRCAEFPLSVQFSMSREPPFRPTAPPSRVAELPLKVLVRSIATAVPPPEKIAPPVCAAFPLKVQPPTVSAVML